MILNRRINYIDPSCFSGSTELLRAETGYEWILHTDTDGTQTVGFQEGAANDTAGRPTTQAQLARGNPDSKSGRLQYVALQPLFQTTANLSTAVPNFKIPGRIYGVNDGTIRSDTEWRAFLLGGTYGEQKYPGIYTEGTFDDYGTDYELPYTYSQYRALHGVNGGGYQYARISYKYNQYLRNFEEWSTAQPSVKMLPSIAFMEMTSSGIQLPSPVQQLITWEGQYNLASALTPTETMILPPEPFEGDPTTEGYDDYTKNLRAYLDSLRFSGLSDETSAGLISETANIFYGEAAFTELVRAGHGSDAATILQHYPYYTSIEFERPNTTEDEHFRNIFHKFDFSTQLLFLLKNAYVDGTFPIEQKHFSAYEEYDESLQGVVYQKNQLAEKSFRTVDLFPMLLSGYNRSAGGSPYYVLDSPNETNQFNKTVTDLRTGLDSDRFLNSYTNMSVMTGLLSYLDNRYTPFPEDLNHFQIDEDGKAGIYELFKKADTPNYRETIAYRVEKIGQNETQNIWFYNSLESEMPFRYLDSQVKYGNSYTYNVYAYVLVTGMKYNMQDLRIGKNISTGSGPAKVQFCIQFHDPYTDELTDQLYAKSYDGLEQQTSRPGTYGVYNDLGDSNMFSSDAQAISDFQYLADFNLYYEPSLRILEVPIISNTVAILDNPAAGIDVVPFQRIDNSQTLGFVLEGEPFQKNLKFPAILGEDDLKYRGLYWQSKGLAPEDFLSEESVSKHAYIEIYRKIEKPTTLVEFEPHLYKTIQLKIDDMDPDEQMYYFANEIFYDKVNANQKYYYLFRFLNEHFEPGHSSAIIEAELVDDGGYKYAIFNELFEKDLKENVFSNPSTPFKKLLQVVPSPQQLFINTTQVDFTQTAQSQLSNVTLGSEQLEESIFDQRFKIRLTSKKTGKKIDLNLKFNLTNGV